MYNLINGFGVGSELTILHSALVAGALEQPYDMLIYLLHVDLQCFYMVVYIGMSSNFAGKRLPKDHIIFEALGTNDQLSSTIGYGSV